VSSEVTTDQKLDHLVDSEDQLRDQPVRDDVQTQQEEANEVPSEVKSKKPKKVS